jgi:hypothetical protein
MESLKILLSLYYFVVENTLAYLTAPRRAEVCVCGGKSSDLMGISENS